MDMQLEPRNRKKLSPTRLPQKLWQIRRQANLTQAEMLRIVNPLEATGRNRARVGQYETGKRVPSLVEVQNYANYAEFGTEFLMNDDLNLPDPIWQPGNWQIKPPKKAAGKRPEGASDNGGKGRKSNRRAIYYAAPPPFTDDSVRGEADSPGGSDTRSRSAFESAAEQPERSGQREQQNAPDTAYPSGKLFLANAAMESAVPADDEATAAVLTRAEECFSMVFSAEGSRDCKAMYHETTDPLSLNQIARLPPAVLVELAVAAARDDLRTGGAESDFARRVRLFLATEPGG